MKKFFALLSMAFVLTFLIISCSVPTAEVSELLPPTHDEIVQPDDPSQIENDITPAIGGYSELNRAYIDPVCDIHYCVLLRGDDVYKWVDEVYSKQSREEMNSLPDLYQAIKAFDITKEELISVKDGKLTLEIINALYLPEEQMKSALASDISLVYGGNVYSYYDVMGLWEDENSKLLSESLKNDIPLKVRCEYADRIKGIIVGIYGEKAYDEEYEKEIDEFWFLNEKEKRDAEALLIKYQAYESDQLAKGEKIIPSEEYFTQDERYLILKNQQEHEKKYTGVVSDKTISSPEP